MAAGNINNNQRFLKMSRERKRGTEKDEELE